MPVGPAPTGIVATGASLIRSIAVTVPSAVLPTYAKRCSPGRRNAGRSSTASSRAAITASSTSRNTSR